MSEEKLNQFMAIYTPALKEAVIKYPEEYYWSVDKVPEVAEKMRAAIMRGSYDKDGRAFPVACKALGIKHTYKAITEYLNS